MPPRLCAFYQENKNPSRVLSLILVGGGDARKMQGNFLVFAHASPRACPRDCLASPRNRSVRGSFKPPRAPRVRLVVKILRILSEVHSNFVQYTPPVGKCLCWLALCEGSPADFKRKLEFFIFAPLLRGWPKAGFPNFHF